MAAGSAVPVPASHLDVARDAEPATKAANAAMAAKLPFGDQPAGLMFDILTPGEGRP